MAKNKKIEESKKIIKQEKEKIKLEKKNLKEKRKEKFKKTKLGKVLSKIGNFFKIKKNTFNKSQMLVISILSTLFGIIISLLIVFILIGGSSSVKFIHNNKKLLDVYKVLLNNYYGEIDEEELEDNLINSMVETTGDNYTNYGNSEVTTSFDETLSGVYEGIGCAITEVDNQIVVVTVYEDTPSEKAGLKVNDIILEVDGQDASELGSTKLSNYIRNEASDKITIKVKREEEELELKVKRDTVEIPVVSSQVIEYENKKVGYLSISIFSSVSSKQFKSNIESLEKEGIDALIIDVRDNNGGFLTQVSEISSMLLPKGKIIYQIEGEKKNEVVKDTTKEKREYPIAVLINEGSASASEILASVIKESYNGYVVGETSYGKGTVQQVKKLKDGSMIKYTIENWLTPNGTWINKKGVEPTDEVILSDEYYTEPTQENDNQLQKALELVTK